MKPEQRAVKSHGSKKPSMADQRRAMVLQRQKEARRDMTDHSRKLAAAGVQSEHKGQSETGDITAEMGDVSLTEKSGPKEKQNYYKELEKFYAREFMYPSWMLEPPSDLCSDWLMLARPEGTRVLVVANNGETVSRKRTGKVLHRFNSALPNGSRRTHAREGHCILDCIFYQPEKVYYVVDLMCWKGYSLYDSTTEFRFFWIQSKLSETSVETINKQNKFRFAPLPVLPVTAANFKLMYPDQHQRQLQLQVYRQAQQERQQEVERVLQLLEQHKQQLAATTKQLLSLQPQPVDGSAQAWQVQLQHQQLHTRQSQLQACVAQHTEELSVLETKAKATCIPAIISREGYAVDGFLFFHRETHYIGGAGELVLLWKDAGCSRFEVDTSDGTSISSLQEMTLELKGKQLVTLEGTVVATLGGVISTDMVEGSLLRFSLGGLAPGWQEAQYDERRIAPLVTGLKYLGPASVVRSLPDSWSKVAFQVAARLGQNLSAAQLMHFLQSAMPLQSNPQSAQQAQPLVTPNRQPSFDFGAATLGETTPTQQ